MEVITSIENEKVKYWSKLNQKKYREETNMFLAEGEHLVLEAMKAGLVREIIMEEDKLFPIDLPKHYVTKEVLNRISNLQSAPDIMAVCYKKKESELKDRLLLIDSLQDPGNLGTIIRTAVAFHIDTIVLNNDTVDEYNDKCIRASEGMIFHINIIHHSLDTFIPELKEKGYHIYGTRVTHGTSLKEAKVYSKYAFIVGNEGAGVKEELLDLCDENLYIPMSEDCESLNVGVATGIILYELESKYHG